MPLRQLLAGIIIVMCLCTGLLGQTGTLTVKVRDAATEEPLRQAQVTLSTFGGGSDSHRAFTDNTGTAILSGLLVGNYYLEVRAPGYLPSRESIDLPPGAMQSADVGLRVEQKPAPGLPGSTTTADELGVPKKARKHFEEGARKVDSDPQEAARSFQKAIDEYPQFARAYAMLGVCQMRLKQWDAAEQSAKKATEIDPAMSMAHTLLAKIYLQQNNFTEAEAQLLEAARLDPESWEAPYQLARCYSSTKQFDKAMASGLRAHAMSSSPATVHLLMVDLYSAVHDRAGALRELEEYAKADPKSPYMAAVRKRIDDLKKN
jgi:cytochrome c-type biogenesis protein CcmH/NrfG